MADELEGNYEVEDISDDGREVESVGGSDDDNALESVDPTDAGGAADERRKEQHRQAKGEAQRAREAQQGGAGEEKKLSKRELKRKRREEEEERRASRPADEDLDERQRAKRAKKKEKFAALKEKRRAKAAEAAAAAFGGAAEQPQSSSSSAPQPPRTGKQRRLCGDIQLLGEAEAATAFFRMRREAGAADGQRLSALELEDEAKAAAEAFVSAGKDARYHSLTRLCGLLRGVFPDHERELSGPAATSSKSFGAPMAVVVCASAVRAVEVVRALRGLEPRTLVAKLFSKHMKKKEQEEMLAKTDVRMAVGTPARLCALAASGALRTGRLRFVVVDMWRNTKNFSLFDMPELKADFWQLYNGHVHPRVSAGTARVCLF